MAIKGKFFIVCFFVIVFRLTSPAFCEEPPSGAGGHLALLITGLSGDHQFKIYMKQAREEMREVLSANGYEPQQIVLFSEEVRSDQVWARNQVATRKNIEGFLNEEHKRSKPYEQAFVFICGHANGYDEKAMFHLLGTDIAYKDLIEGIDKIPARKMTIVVIAPQGQVWIQKLGQPGRVIIAGNGLRQFDFIPTLFLRFFPKNLRGGVPVLPAKAKNEKRSEVSLGDAFIRTQKDVQNWYRISNLYPTEVAMIDADGDGKGKTLILKGVEFDSWAEGERQAKEILEPLAGDPAVQKKTAPSSDLSKKEIELPMDLDLPDAKAAQSLIFTIPGVKKP